MTFSQKYCAVHFFEPLPDNTIFPMSEWPPHCTIVGVFALQWTDGLRKEFRNLTHDKFAVNSRVTGSDFFGPNRSLHVKLLEPTRALIDLHEAVAGFIESHGGSFNEPNYVHDGFKPHITQTSNFALADNSTLALTSVSLIDMFPDGDHTMRRVLETIDLKLSR